jgi:hypothetical protein
MLNYASPQIPVEVGVIPMMTTVGVAFCLLGVFGVLLLSCTVGGAVGLAVFWIFGDRRVDYLGAVVMIGAMLLIGSTFVTLCWIWIRAAGLSSLRRTQRL